MKKLIALAAVLLGFTASSFAQLNAIAQISANIVSPTSITKNLDMNFFSIYTPLSGPGTVHIPPTGDLVTREFNNISAVATGTGGQNAKFTIECDPGTDPSITLPYNTPISLFNGIDFINVILDFSNIESKKTSSSPSAAPGATVILNQSSSKSGQIVFWIGGTLYVDKNQSWGSYSNSTDLEIIVNQ